MDEDLNWGATLSWAITDGILSGVASIADPGTHLKAAISFLQFASSGLQSNFDFAETGDWGAFALSLGMTLITMQVPSDVLGDGIDALVSFAADSTETTINVGRKNANTPIESTSPTYRNSRSSTRKPVGAQSRRRVNAGRAQALTSVQSRNPRSRYCGN